MAIALTAAVLTACGRTSTPTSTSSGITIDDSPAKGVVTIWLGGSAPDGQDPATNLLGAAFLKANPGLEAQVTYIPYDDFYTKLQTAIAAGTGPDLAWVDISQQAQFIAAGGFQPIPKGVDTSPFFASGIQAGTYKGVAYTIPTSTQSRVLFYRKDLAKAAGVEAPKTWADFIPFLKGLKEAGAVNPWAGDVGWDSYTGSAWANYALQAGSKLLNKAGDGWDLDTPETIAATKQFVAPFKAGLSSADGPGFLDQDPYFISGKTAAVVTGSWDLTTLTLATSKEWVEKHVGTAKLPAGPAGSQSQLEGGAIGVTVDAKNAVAAWKVAVHLASKKSQLQSFTLGSNLPSRDDVWDSPELSGNSQLQAFRKQTQVATVLPRVSTLTEVLTMIGAQLETVVRGTATPAEAMAKVQSQAESIGVGK